MGIVLLDPNNTIEVVLTGTVTANELSWVVTYVDYSAQGVKALPVTAFGVTTGTTPVTVVPAIDQRKANRRVLTEFHVYNDDTTAEEVTVSFNANGTTYNLWKESLAAGKSLQYLKGDGFIAQP